MIGIGDLVRFAPNPRYPDSLITAKVIRKRADPRMKTRMGWLDTIDAAGFERSVRPSRCEKLEL